MPQREERSSPRSGSREDDDSPGDLIDDLPAFLGGNAAGKVFEYVSAQPRRKPRVDGEEERAATKKLSFVAPRGLHEVLSRTFRKQRLSKTRAFVAYAHVHVTLSELFGAGAASDASSALAEPTFSEEAPLHQLYEYATRRIEYPEGKEGGPEIAIQVPLSLARLFKSWSARQGRPMTGIMTRYALFHLNQYRRQCGSLPVPEDMPSRWWELPDYDSPDASDLT